DRASPPPLSPAPPADRARLRRRRTTRADRHAGWPSGAASCALQIRLERLGNPRAGVLPQVQVQSAESVGGGAPAWRIVEPGQGIRGEIVRGGGFLYPFRHHETTRQDV